MAWQMQAGMSEGTAKAGGRCRCPERFGLQCLKQGWRTAWQEPVRFFTDSTTDLVVAKLICIVLCSGAPVPPHQHTRPHRPVAGNRQGEDGANPPEQFVPFGKLGLSLDLGMVSSWAGAEVLQQTNWWHACSERRARCWYGGALYRGALTGTIAELRAGLTS